MNTLDTIYSRKSVRSYTGEQISAEDLAVILGAANAAPIGRGQYDTMHLTLIQNPELLSEIDRTTAAVFGDPSLTPLYGAPTMVLVSAKTPEPGMANVTYSNAAIVVQNMALAATELGVGVCHIWGAVRAICATPELQAKFQLPEGFEPCCAVILGKTTEVYSRRDIPAGRIALNEIK